MAESAETQIKIENLSALADRRKIVVDSLADLIRHDVAAYREIAQAFEARGGEALAISLKRIADHSEQTLNGIIKELEYGCTGAHH